MTTQIVKDPPADLGYRPLEGQLWGQIGKQLSALEENTLPKALVQLAIHLKQHQSTLHVILQSDADITQLEVWVWLLDWALLNDINNVANHVILNEAPPARPYLEQMEHILLEFDFPQVTTLVGHAGLEADALETTTQNLLTGSSRRHPFSLHAMDKAEHEELAAGSLPAWITDLRFQGIGEKDAILLLNEAPKPLEALLPKLQAQRPNAFWVSLTPLHVALKSVQTILMS